MLPSHFAPWELVYYYYRKWSSLGEFDLLLNNLREKVRVKSGQKAKASVGIMDSQSVRWGNNRSLNGIDDNKKVKGIKRHCRCGQERFPDSYHGNNSLRA